MNIKPIFFNTEMVQAIIDRRKTQTRRRVKAIEGLNVYRAEPSEDAYDTLRKWDFFYGWNEGNACFDAIESVMAPCAIGDILWVRETWTLCGEKYYYRADFESDFLDPCETLSGGYPMYCLEHPGCIGCMREPERIRWRPSIHMPKEAARIFLRIKNVRAERLQSMTDEDAAKEGYREQYMCEHCAYSGGEIVGMCWAENDCSSPFNYCEHSIPESFGYDVWDKTIKRDELSLYGWNANPYVWVIEFERCEKPKEWCGNE